MIESITKGDAIVAYEAHIRKSGKTHEIKVGTDGQLLPQGQGEAIVSVSNGQTSFSIPC